MLVYEFGAIEEFVLFFLKSDLSPALSIALPPFRYFLLKEKEKG